MLSKQNRIAAWGLIALLAAIVSGLGPHTEAYKSEGQRVAAGVGGDYDLNWKTIDGGGGFSESGSYKLGYTIGQHDAGTVAMAGYQLTGGFWAGVCVCIGDLNADCEIEAFDLAMLLGDWGPCDVPCEPGDPATTCAADLSGDCDVGAFDLAMLLGAWGVCP